MGNVRNNSEYELYYRKKKRGRRIFGAVAAFLLTAILVPILVALFVDRASPRLPAVQPTIWYAELDNMATDWCIVNDDFRVSMHQDEYDVFVYFSIANRDTQTMTVQNVEVVLHEYIAVETATDYETDGGYGGIGEYFYYNVTVPSVAGRYEANLREGTYLKVMGEDVDEGFVVIDIEEPGVYVFSIEIKYKLRGDDYTFTTQPQKIYYIESERYRELQQQHWAEAGLT